MTFLSFAFHHKTTMKISGRKKEAHCVLKKTFASNARIGICVENDVYMSKYCVCVSVDIRTKRSHLAMNDINIAFRYTSNEHTFKQNRRRQQRRN